MKSMYIEDLLKKKVLCKYKIYKYIMKKICSDGKYLDCQKKTEEVETEEHESLQSVQTL